MSSSVCLFVFFFNLFLYTSNLKGLWIEAKVKLTTLNISQTLLQNYNASIGSFQYIFCALLHPFLNHKGSFQSAWLSLALIIHESNEFLL